MKAQHLGSVAATRVCAHKSTTLIDVRLAPTSGAKADIPLPPLSAISGREQMQQVAPLFDHLVGAAEHRERESQAERSCGVKIDHQFDSHGLLHREVGRLLALENSADVDGGLSICFRNIGP